MPYSYSIGTLGTHSYAHTAGFVIKIGKKSRDFNFSHFFSRTIKTTGSEALCTFSHYTFTEFNLTVLIFKKAYISIIK